jgi:hypothetical protein
MLLLLVLPCCCCCCCHVAALLLLPLLLLLLLLLLAPVMYCCTRPGGVAANRKVRTALQALADGYKLPFVVPPAQFCSDNGLMVAWTGVCM